MLDYLAAVGIPTLVVLTKVDKLKSSQRERTLKVATDKLGVDPDQVLPVSAHTGEGREELLGAVASLLGMEDGS